MYFFLLSCLLFLRFSFLPAVFITEAQQTKKIYRVGRLSGALSSSTFSLDALRESCGRSVMSRVGTSPLSFAPRKKSPSGSPLWRMSWFVSRSISSLPVVQTMA